MILREIRWDELAAVQLERQLNYIREESPEQADKVRDKILEKVDELIRFPERYPPDKYKKDNDGTYRAFEQFHYRISYRITPECIHILRFRSVWQNPQNL